MNDRVFLDTNFVIYLYTEDEDNKRNIAYEHVNKDTCITSTQVCNEACNIWFRKYNWNKDKINTHLDEIETVCDEVLLVQRKTINQALSIKDRYGYSYYDSLILASALEAGCSIILTEDMSDGQLIFSKLKITNPFGK